MSVIVVGHRRRTPVSLLGAAVALALLGTGTALATSGSDWAAMLEACQRAMAAMGIHTSAEQMRSMMAGCIGVGH